MIHQDKLEGLCDLHLLLLPSVLVLDTGSMSVHLPDIIHSGDVYHLTRMPHVEHPEVCEFRFLSCQLSESQHRLLIRYEIHQVFSAKWRQLGTIGMPEGNVVWN